MLVQERLLSTLKNELFSHVLCMEHLAGTTPSPGAGCNALSQLINPPPQPPVPSHQLFALSIYLNPGILKNPHCSISIFHRRISEHFPDMSRTSRPIPLGGG